MSDIINNAKLGTYTEAIDVALAEMDSENVVSRIWDIDHTVWSEDPTEISNRLGWLTVIEAIQNELGKVDDLVNSVQANGYTNTLVLGMGGSSLAPEVFSMIWPSDTMKVDVLDSTDPDTVLAYRNTLDLSKTLFIVATKSGGTVETLSFFKYFYNETAAVVGADNVGEHFVAITDPGSKLVTLAEEYSFRETFINDPNIGGRYAALSFFGLVPAALTGVDVPKLLANAVAMANSSGKSVAPAVNPGAWLGVAMGELAKAGRNKLTFLLSSSIAGWADWVEQLIAESTGKVGKGILPVAHEPTVGPDDYTNDRVFVYIQLAEEDEHGTLIDDLAGHGHPVITVKLGDAYDLGGQFWLWEFATAVAGYRMEIQPFNQPNVESAKVQARKMTQAYSETGALPELELAISDGATMVYGDTSANSATGALAELLDKVGEGDYVSIHAYVTPSEAVTAQLQAMRKAILIKTSAATTYGYGPRFLHSTGQLHKGDDGTGVFIQILDIAGAEVAIPETAGEDASNISFNVLIRAQALGDRQALINENRRVLTFDLTTDTSAGLQALVDSLA